VTWTLRPDTSDMSGSLCPQQHVLDVRARCSVSEGRADGLCCGSASVAGTSSLEVSGFGGTELHTSKRGTQRDLSNGRRRSSKTRLCFGPVAADSGPSILYTSEILQVMGSTNYVMLRMSSLRKVLAKNVENEGDELGLKTCVSLIESLDDEILTNLTSSGCQVYRVVQEQGDLLWIPTGFLVAYRTLDSPLHYGIRKSIFNSSRAAREDLAAVCELQTADGDQPSRLAKVLELYPAYPA
jgi:hypothetical protein